MTADVPANATMDRICEPCAAGLYDHDADHTTMCVQCSSTLEARVDFGSIGVLTIEDNGDASIISSDGLNLDAPMQWRLHNRPSKSGSCTDPSIGGVFGADQVPASTAGELGNRNGALGGGGAFSRQDDVFTLFGRDSAFGREIVLYDEVGNVTYCATVEEWKRYPTFASGTGSIECSAVSNCSVGEYEIVPFSRTSDRSCAACIAGSFQDTAGKRFCDPVATCSVGFTEASGGAPTPSSDRVCTVVQCPGLTPPEYGFVEMTPDSGTPSLTASIGSYPGPTVTPLACPATASGTHLRSLCSHAFCI